MAYDHQNLEQKWQKYWNENKTFRTENPNAPLSRGDQGGFGIHISEQNPPPLRSSSLDREVRPKKYILDMFPYPSGAGLHVGHPKGYTATDIVSRYYHATGHNVLHTIGFDAFGLPAENYAIKTGTHPAITTAENITVFTQQLQSLGFSYDWDRMVDTTDPEYYGWTQWIFLELFKRGLAYEQDLPINYCPSCKTGLANEEVLSDNTCDRCGTRVERRPIRQWVLRITEYADRLLSDLDGLDWPEGIKEMQRNWIGRSEGCEFRMQKSDDTTKSISVYTTRVDTVYGMTYAVLAPDHPQVQYFITESERVTCEQYIERAKGQSDLDRTNEGKEKTGVWTGSYVVNPFNGESVPLWIADYVLGSYGTGAVMAVPDNDERDWEFAKKYDLKIREVVLAPDGREDIHGKPYTKDGMVHDPRNPNNVITSAEARSLFANIAETEGFGQKKVNYKLRDWLFSRQRYWGEPIPLIHIANEDYAKLPRTENTKKRENCYSEEGVTHNGDTAKFSLFTGSIFQNIEEVKKKDRNVAFSELDVSVKTEIGTIRFLGRSLEKHFSNKSRTEMRLRKRIRFSVIEGLSRLVYESDELGYFVFKDQVVRVVLKVISPGEFIIKTYYVSKTLSVVYEQFSNTASIVVTPEYEDLYIGNKKFSKIYTGITGKLIIDSRLPLTLPQVEKYEPAGDGQSPLATVPDWVNVKLAENLAGKRETNTMPQWGGSCWYYLRYMDPHNSEILAGKEALGYWQNVDEYVGGAEHAVLHLLYARFWHKVLYDIGVVPTIEPFHKLTNVGLILGPDGNKMSKSKGNVINPNDIVAEYGADTLRLYEMSLSAFTDAAPWNPDAIIGVRRFLDKAYSTIVEGKNKAKDDMRAMKLLHKTVKKVGEDIVTYKFNTAISALYILLNEGIPNDPEFATEWSERFVIMLHPFAPHMAEELWNNLGKIDSIYNAEWPSYDEWMLIDDEVTIAIQINGKLRGTYTGLNGVMQDEVSAYAHETPDIAKWLENKTLVKEIFIPNKMLSIVIKDA